MIGKRLLHYHVLEEIGRGGMGEVYLAQDTRLGRKVALKVLPKELGEDPVRRRRFERESRVVAALNHPNIVTIHAVEELDDDVFLVMELIDGESLAHRLDAGPLGVDEALEVALPMTRAVAAAHEAGVVHRDLKPENVMVRSDGMVKVVDFGLSRMESMTMAGGKPFTRDGLTREGTVVGTIHYMAPEQLEGRRADSRSDVFSLGVMLYEMVTGHPPFAGGNPISVASAILRDQPPPLEPTRGPVPEALRGLIFRCLEKEAARRFANAGELHAALAAVREQRQVGRLLAARDGEAGRRARWLRGGAAALGLVVLLGLAWWVTTRRSPPAAAPAPDVALAGAQVAAAGSPVAAVGSRVAVLPIRNLTGEAADSYLAEGTTEALIAHLAKVRELRVIAHDSVRAIDPAATSLAETARQLGVGYLVTGSVTRHEESVALVVQLVAPGEGETLWGDTFQGTLSELFSFYPRVATEVTRVARVDLPAADALRLARQPDVTDEAYDLYLRGLQQLAERRPESIQRALVLFRQATAEAPGFAQAWAASSEAYWRLGTFGYAVAAPTEVLPRAEEAARRALELDGGLPEGWAALGSTLVHLWRWQEAETALRRAIAENPSDAQSRLAYTAFLVARGRHREAQQQIDQAVALAPLTRAILNGAAAVEHFAGDYAMSAARSRQNLDIDDGFWLFHLQLGEALAELDDHREAAVAHARAVELSGGNAFARVAQALGKAAAGDRRAAPELLSQLEAEARVGYVTPSLLAKLAFAAGQSDRGFGYLDTAFAQRDSLLTYLAVDPHYRGVREMPRFQALLRRLGLEEVL